MKLPAKAMQGVLCLAGVFTILLLKGGFVFLLLALLPSVVAYYIDHEPRKPIFKIVLTWNFSSTIPFLVPLFKAGIGMESPGIAALMSNPHNWLFIYGGAAVGWCLIYLCRLIGRFIVTLTYEYHFHYLEGLQKRLLEEWGQQIRETK